MMCTMPLIMRKKYSEKEPLVNQILRSPQLKVLLILSAEQFCLKSAGVVLGIILASSGFTKLSNGRCHFKTMQNSGKISNFSALNTNFPDLKFCIQLG